jgi:predicted transcriptional regulator
MEVRLSADKEAQLARIAAEQGRDADVLAQEVLGEYLKVEARFIEAVKKGEAALETGDYLSHEEVGKRLIQS